MPIDKVPLDDIKKIAIKYVFELEKDKRYDLKIEKSKYYPDPMLSTYISVEIESAEPHTWGSERAWKLVGKILGHVIDTKHRDWEIARRYFEILILAKDGEVFHYKPYGWDDITIREPETDINKVKYVISPPNNKYSFKNRNRFNQS